jgi:rRNA processing protein Krr1/Pno1
MEDAEVVMIPDSCAGLIIGKGGETLKSIQSSTATKIIVGGNIDNQSSSY